VGLSEALTALSISSDKDVAPEEQLRANGYRLLARFLSAPPTSVDLASAAALEGGDSELGRAIATFAHLAGRTDEGTVREEYEALFIGLARGEIVPYGSYYLTGFLHEKPLAKLRQDMMRLGVERDPAVRDPEDHIASLCEMMAGFIDGSFGGALGIGEQKRFFDNHLGCWAGYFFRDLEAAQSSVLYAALGAVGRTFLEIERAAFELSGAPDE
jgi:TorA maturation chaperone TorD